MKGIYIYSHGKCIICPKLFAGIQGVIEHTITIIVFRLAWSIVDGNRWLNESKQEGGGGYRAKIKDVQYCHRHDQSSMAIDYLKFNQWHLI